MFIFRNPKSQSLIEHLILVALMGVITIGMYTVKPLQLSWPLLVMFYKEVKNLFLPLILISFILLLFMNKYFFSNSTAHGELSFWILSL